MNLDIQSKHQRTFFASVLDDHSIGPHKSRSHVSNSFIELANEMKKTYSNNGDIHARKSTDEEVVYEQNIFASSQQVEDILHKANMS